MAMTLPLWFDISYLVFSSIMFGVTMYLAYRCYKDVKEMSHLLEVLKNRRKSAEFTFRRTEGRS